MGVPASYRYTKDHEWVKLEGRVATIGITDYAQSELGDVVFVDLPAAGKSFEKGETLAVVESVKAASDIYSPVAGTVSETNAAVTSSPETINSSPFEAGWLVKVEVKDPSEFDQLMDAAAYDSYIEGMAK